MKYKSKSFCNNIRSNIIIFFLLLYCTNIRAQYEFSGIVKNDSLYNSVILLSLIDDYRELHKFSENNVINKTKIDSLGFFVFKGDNLPDENRYYKIHLADEDGNPFFYYDVKNGHNFVIFIANNTDVVKVNPTSTSFFGKIETPSKSDAAAIMTLDSIKHTLIESLVINNSSKNQELFYSYYFKTIREYSSNFKDPLAKLAGVDFLYQIDDSGQPFFLKDYKEHPEFYKTTLTALRDQYPDLLATKIYEDDLEFASIKLDIGRISRYKKWIIGLSVFSALLLVFIFYLLLGNNKFLFKKIGSKTKNRELTKQELNILKFVQEGKSNKEIGEQLFISVSTVKTHVYNIYSKLNLSSRNELKNYKK